MIVKIRNTAFILRTLPLALFVGYYCCISFFTHTHVIDGATVAHSHPYKKAANGKPIHDHNAAQLRVIFALSQFTATGSVSTLEVEAPHQLCEVEYINTSNAFLLSEAITGLYLRAPPLKV